MDLRKSPTSIDDKELAVASFAAIQFLLQSVESYRVEIYTLNSKISELIAEVSELKLANSAVLKSPKLKIDDAKQKFKYGEKQAVVMNNVGAKYILYVYSILSKSALMWKDGISTDPPDSGDLAEYGKSAYELI